MKAINYTEFRKFMKENMNLVVDSSETIVIQRAGGKTVVVVSLAEYNSIVETNYLLSTNANTKNLEKSIKNYKKGKTRTLNPDEL
jgi:antitoxin YefM